MLKVSYSNIPHRYHLLLGVKTTEEVDMQKLRRKGLSSVWIAFWPFVVLSQAPVYALLSSQGWPEVPPNQIDGFYLNIATIVSVIAINFSDLISVGIFLKMLYHFSKKNVVNVSPENNGQGVEDFGGIWVGGAGDISMQEVNAEDGDNASNESVLSAESASVSNSNNNNSDNKDDAVQADHKAEAVMQTLWRYLLLAPVDIIVVIGMLYVCSPVGKAAFYVYVFVSDFWIPFYLIKSSFTQMNDFGKCC